MPFWRLTSLSHCVIRKREITGNIVSTIVEEADFPIFLLHYLDEACQGITVRHSGIAKVSCSLSHAFPMISL